MANHKKTTVKKKPAKKKPADKLGAYIFGGLTGTAAREANKRKMRLDKI